MGLASNALLGHLPAIWAPARAAGPDGAGRIHAADKSAVDNGVDEVLVWVKDALLALETMAVDQTEHNIRVLLDALWSARDDAARAGRRALLRGVALDHLEALLHFDEPRRLFSVRTLQ